MYKSAHDYLLCFSHFACLSLIQTWFQYMVHVYLTNNELYILAVLFAIPGPFYEAQFGVEIFVELYTLRFHHQSPPKCCKDTLPFYFINFSVVVYWYYGYLPIS